MLDLSEGSSVTNSAIYGGIITGVGLPNSIPGSSNRAYINSVESGHNDFSGHVQVRIVDVSKLTVYLNQLLKHCVLFLDWKS